MARTHSVSVFKNCARAANPDAATKFRPGQSKIVTKKPEQRCVVVRFGDSSDAVNCEIEFGHDRGIISTLLKTGRSLRRSKFVRTKKR